MADQEKEKQLDALLDSLLSQYSDVEPRPGLETRVLAAVAHAGTQTESPWWNAWWVWMGAAATAVLALLIFMLLPWHTSEKPVPPLVENNTPSRSVEPPRVIRPENDDTTGKAAMGPHIKRMQDTAAVTATEVRRNVFPTPVPLSEQEKLVLRYLARTPREELVAQSHPEPALDEDLLQGSQGVFNPVTSRNSGNSN